MTTDAKILSALRANPGGVSGAQLAEQLDISRAAIWARIDDLRKAGYDIEASPHFGYKRLNGSRGRSPHQKSSAATSRSLSRRLRPMT
jgi:biotin operon repressor BirA-like protein